jgi:hypothetical protein
MAFAQGRLYSVRLSYKPVFSEEKSGIPELVLIPAPVIMATFLNLPYLSPSKNSSYVNFGVFCVSNLAFLSLSSSIISWSFLLRLLSLAKSNSPSSSIIGDSGF